MLCVFKRAIDCREGWNGSERKTEQKPSIKSVLSRAEFERLEVENFCRNLHIAQVVLFRRAEKQTWCSTLGRIRRFYLLETSRN